MVNEDTQDILRDLRKRKIEVTSTMKKDIVDYNNFRKSLFGNIKLVNEGIGMDVHWMELHNIKPDMFPLDITNPSDQLQYIAELVTELNKPYLLKYIVGQQELEYDIITIVNNYIQNQGAILK